jgi:hypothetical protein
MYHLLLLIYIYIFLGILVSFSYIVYILFCSNTYKVHLYHLENLSKTWIILKPLCFISNLIISEPYIPKSKKIQLGNCSIYLANIPYKITKKRLMLELMCFLDLYNHKKKKDSILKYVYTYIYKEKEEYYTAISEQSYIQVQWLLKSSNINFNKEIEIYLNKIRWTSNCLQYYNPNDDVIYFSSI